MIMWEPKDLKRNLDYRWEIGSFKLWIRRTDVEWLVAYEHQPENLDADKPVIAKRGKKPEELVWNRFVFEDPSCTIQLMPSLQDRAVVVSSETPVRILPNNSAIFFVSIPIWISIFAGEGMKAMLTEIPTIILSNTWFGDPMNGELCYSLSTHARRLIEELRVSPQRAVCPFRIKNNSSEHLDFQMIAVNVEHLRLYLGPERLWTNEVFIDFFSRDQASQIDISDKVPSVIKDCRFLREERVPFDKSILKKSITILRSFTNF
jgi:hypothetical protein